MLALNACLALVYSLAIISALSTHMGSTQDWNHPRLTLEVLLKECVEVSLLSLFYFNIRPRDWPAFFTLEMHED